MGSDGFGAAARAFFSTYQADFERFDQAAIVGHFAVPGHAVSEAEAVGVLPIAEQAGWDMLIGRILGMYRAIGVARADVLAQEILAVSDRVGVVRMGWQLRDGDGAELYRFESTYTLVDAGEGLRIVALAANELPAYLACYRALVAAGKVAPPPSA